MRNRSHPIWKSKVFSGCGFQRKMKPSSVCIPVCALSRLGTQIALQSWAPLKKEVNDIWKNSTGDLAEALQSEDPIWRLIQHLGWFSKGLNEFPTVKGPLESFWWAYRNRLQMNPFLVVFYGDLALINLTYIK